MTPSAPRRRRLSSNWRGRRATNRTRPDGNSGAGLEAGRLPGKRDRHAPRPGAADPIRSGKEPAGIHPAAKLHRRRRSHFARADHSAHAPCNRPALAIHHTPRPAVVSRLSGEWSFHRPGGGNTGIEPVTPESQAQCSSVELVANSTSAVPMLKPERTRRTHEAHRGRRQPSTPRAVHFTRKTRE